jgi:glutamate formiminotransferase/formiminotetrahydrofolate cyclodeaminase
MMARKLVECVPNFSEGRRLEVVDALASVVGKSPGVFLLDRHSDADHNRSVLTFAGEPQAVSDAAFKAIALAAREIDLDRHTGEHPRIGATDVVPFVPLGNTTMQECVELARGLGRRVGDELGIPVYLYEAAATRSDRVNLENIRRGEYEGLKGSITTDPERLPDFGPARIGPAGATVIGARQFLIAFNVYLATDDISVAKAIAKVIRTSSGGLPSVKALGMLVEGLAQVSMNLTDFTETSVPRVVEAIRQEAEQRGTSIHHSELVGLIPQAAVVDTARWYLKLDRFSSEQVLEARLFDALSTEADSKLSFLDQLAEGTPTPGGGSAAAQAGAMAAALISMVARLTLGKKKYAEVESRMKQIIEQSEAMRAELTNAVAADANAFDGVMQAMRMPHASPEDEAARAEAMERAMHQAAAVPLEVARRAKKLIELAAELAETGNVNAITDAGSGAAMARAALRAASLNVRVNASGVSDQKAARAWLNQLTELEHQAFAAEARLHEALRQRTDLEL